MPKSRHKSIIRGSEYGGSNGICRDCGAKFIYIPTEKEEESNIVFWCPNDPEIPNTKSSLLGTEITNSVIG